MLYEPDAAIARRDPGLPGLATLLDPEAFSEALHRAVPGANLQSIHPVYAKYTPGTNCLIGYRCRVNGDNLPVYAKSYPADSVKKLGKARKKPGVPGPLGPGRLALDKLNRVVSGYPNDGKVKALSLMADQQHRILGLCDVFPHQPALWDGTVRPLAYKPERRLVTQLDTHAGPQAALTTDTRHGYGASSQANQRFRSCGSLRLAPSIGHSDQYQTLAFGWLPGQILSDVLLDPGFSAGEMELVGTTLAELHNQEAEGLPLHTGVHVAKVLLAERDTLGVLSPTIAPRAQALAQKLAAQMAASTPCDRSVHGNFHARQVLLGGKTVARAEAVFEDAW